jgi:hypothetical protein
MEFREVSPPYSKCSMERYYVNNNQTMSHPIKPGDRIGIESSRSVTPDHENRLIETKSLNLFPYIKDIAKRPYYI